MNLWVKNSSRKRVNRLKIATYNVRTLLRDEHTHMNTKKNERKTRLVWDVIGIREVRRREEGFTTLQSGHLLYYSKAKNGQAGVGFLINRERNDNIVKVKGISPRVAELVQTMRYKLKIVQVYAPTTPYSEEDIKVASTTTSMRLGETKFH